MSTRFPYFLAFLGMIALLTTSLYLQFFDGFMPCPLCTLQRFTFAFLGLIFLLGVFFFAKRAARLVLNFLAILLSVIGVLLAGRQVWLQHFPSAQSGECGVSLQYMLQALPLNEVLQRIIFEGSAECSQRGWEIFYLNMAEWSLICFILLTLFSLYLFLKDFRHR